MLSSPYPQLQSSLNQPTEFSHQQMINFFESLGTRGQATFIEVGGFSPTFMDGIVNRVNIWIILTPHPLIGLTILKSGKNMMYTFAI